MYSSAILYCIAGGIVLNEKRSKHFSRSFTNLNEVGQSTRKSSRGTRDPQFSNKFRSQRSYSTSNLLEDNARSSSRLGPPRRSYIDDEFNHESRSNAFFRSRQPPSVRSFKEKEVGRDRLGSRTISRSSQFSRSQSMRDFDNNADFTQTEQWEKTLDKKSDFSGSKRGCDNPAFKDHHRSNLQRSTLIRSASRHSLRSQFDFEKSALPPLPPPLPAKKKKIGIR